MYDENWYTCLKVLNTFMIKNKQFCDLILKRNFFLTLRDLVPLGNLFLTHAIDDQFPCRNFGKKLFVSKKQRPTFRGWGVKLCDSNLLFSSPRESPIRKTSPIDFNLTNKKTTRENKAYTIKVIEKCQK